MQERGPRPISGMLGRAVCRRSCPSEDPRSPMFSEHRGPSDHLPPLLAPPPLSESGQGLSQFGSSGTKADPAPGGPSGLQVGQLGSGWLVPVSRGMGPGLGASLRLPQ